MFSRGLSVWLRDRQSVNSVAWHTWIEHIQTHTHIYITSRPCLSHLLGSPRQTCCSPPVDICNYILSTSRPSNTGCVCVCARVCVRGVCVCVLCSGITGGWFTVPFIYQNCSQFNVGEKKKTIKLKHKRPNSKRSNSISVYQCSTYEYL